MMKVYSCMGADVGTASLSSSFPATRGSRASLAAEATAVDSSEPQAFSAFCSNTFVERTKKPGPSLLDQLAMARLEEAERRREKAARRAMASRPRPPQAPLLPPPGHTGPAQRILSLSAGGSPLLTTEPFDRELQPGPDETHAELQAWMQRALDAEQQAREQKRMLDQLLEDFRVAPHAPDFASDKQMELAEREVRLEEAEAAAQDRARALQAREAAVRSSEDRIRLEERGLAQLLSEMQRQKRALADAKEAPKEGEREAALRRLERAAVDRETLLSQQQAALDEREAAIAEREAAVAEREAAVEAGRASTDREVARREAEELARSVLRAVDAIHGRRVPGLEFEGEDESPEPPLDEEEDEEEPVGRRRPSAAERLLRSERRWVREQLAAVVRVLQRFLAEGEALRRSAEAAQEDKSHAILSVERMVQQLSRVAADASAAHVEAERLKEVVGTLAARLTSAQSELATLRPRARMAGTEAVPPLPAIPEVCPSPASTATESARGETPDALPTVAAEDAGPAEAPAPGPTAAELEALIAKYERELSETTRAVVDMGAMLERKEAELAEQRREVEQRELDVLDARYVAHRREQEAAEAERAAILARRDNQLLVTKLNGLHGRLGELHHRLARARARCTCGAFGSHAASPSLQSPRTGCM